MFIFLHDRVRCFTQKSEVHFFLQTKKIAPHATNFSAKKKKAKTGHTKKKRRKKYTGLNAGPW
jgi:hypothetical protein